MPYSNISWIKVKLELLSKHAFIEEINDEQRFLFIGLLMLAGLTKNKIPNSAKYIKRMLNSSQAEADIALTITRLCALFPSLRRTTHFIKINKFSRLHNYVGESKGESKGDASIVKVRLDKVSIEKKKMIRVFRKYLVSKNQPTVENASYWGSYRRHCRVIKQLILAADSDEQVCEAIDWATRSFPTFNWTLETLNRQWENFMQSKSKPKQIGPWNSPL